MKHTYKKFYTLIPNASPDLFGRVTYTTICTGGAFYPENGKSFLHFTDHDVVRRNIDRKLDCQRHMYNIFGNPISGISSSGVVLHDTGIDDSIIGDWTLDVEDNATIYYIIMNNNIYKIFLTLYEGLTMTNTTNILYIVNIDGKMKDCLPEEGDIIYDDIAEALAMIKK